MRASVAAGNSARFPFSERVSASRLGERNDAANRFVGRVLSAVRAPLVGSRRVRSSLSAAGDSADRVFDAGACAAFLCVVSRALFSPFLFVCSSFSIEGPQDAVKSSVLSLLHALFELLDVYTTRLAKDRAVRRLVYRICLQLDALGFHDSVSIASSQRRATLRAVFELLSIPFNRKLVARLSSASESKAAMSQSEAKRSESEAILGESEVIRNESKVIRNESKVSESESMAMKSEFSIAQSEFKAALSESPVGSAANSRRSSFARAQRAEFDAEWMRNCGEAAKVRLRETEEAEERAPRGKKTAGRARRRESRGEEAGRAKTRAKTGRWSESPRAASEPTKRWSEKSNRLSESSKLLSESSKQLSEKLSEKSNQLNEKSNRLSEKLSESSKHLSESSKQLSESSKQLNEPSGEPSTEKLDASPDSKEKSIESKSNSTDSPSKPQTETPCFCYQVERDPDALPNPSSRFHYQVDGYSCQCDDCVQNPIELFDTFDPNYENYVSSEEIESFLLYMEFLLLIVKKPNDCFEQSFGSHLSEMSCRYRVL